MNENGVVFNFNIVHTTLIFILIRIDKRNRLNKKKKSTKKQAILFICQYV